MGMNVNQTYCGDHFRIYTNIDSLCYLPDTHIIVNYTSVKNNNTVIPLLVLTVLQKGKIIISDY